MPLDITNMFLVSLAYKSAVIHAMIGEGNFFAERLHLSEPLPIVVRHVRANVNPPLSGGLGSFETDRYFYSFPGPLTSITATNPDGSILYFPQRGKLAYLEKKEPLSKFGPSYIEALDSVAKIPSLLDTNSAYTLATQYLAAISMDLIALEAKHKPLSVQQYCYSPPLSPEEGMRMIENKTPPSPDHKKVPLPIFDITWGGTADQNPPVWVQLLGTTKELIRLRMEDTTFLKRPSIALTNALELNARPDPPKKQITPATRATNNPPSSTPGD